MLQLHIKDRLIGKLFISDQTSSADLSHQCQNRALLFIYKEDNIYITEYYSNTFGNILEGNKSFIYAIVFFIRIFAFRGFLYFPCKTLSAYFKVRAKCNL